MTEEQVQDVIDAFGRAAAAARSVGFDCIEVHGAHGYLIDQFLWSVTNQRSDAWGGDIRRRSRFAAEVIRACRHPVGLDLPIFSRLSQWKIQDYEAEDSSLTLAGWVRKLPGLPTMAVSGVGLKPGEFFAKDGAEAQTGFAALEKMFETRQADLVAVGRALLVDPQWAVNVRERRTGEIVPYVEQHSRELI